MINFIDNIHDYKNGRLSEEEKVQFEKELLSNKFLKDMVDNFDLLNLVGEAAFEEETKNIIKKAIEENKKEFFYLRIIKIIAVAASITLLGYFGFSHYKQNVEMNQRYAIAIENHIPPQVVFTRSGDDITSDKFLKAKEAFSRRDYDKSKEILLSLEPIDEQKDEKYFLLAHIYFYDKQLKLSQKSIDQIKDSKYRTKVKELQMLLDSVKN